MYHKFSNSHFFATISAKLLPQRSLVVIDWLFFTGRRDFRHNSKHVSSFKVIELWRLWFYFILHLCPNPLLKYIYNRKLRELLRVWMSELRHDLFLDTGLTWGKNHIYMIYENKSNTIFLQNKYVGGHILHHLHYTNKFTSDFSGRLWTGDISWLNGCFCTDQVVVTG